MSNIFSLFVLFIINPIVSLVGAFKNQNIRGLKFSFFLIFFFLGFTFYIDLQSRSDIVRVVEMFKHYCHVSLANSGNNIVDYFIFDENKAWEFLLPVICKLVSLISNNNQIFIAFLALIYGYFFTDVFLFLYSSLFGLNKNFKLIILLLFVFTISPFSFQAFRFWTAAMVLVWAAIGVFFTEKPQRIWVMFVFCFLHNALFLPLILIIFNRFNIIPVKYLFNFYVLSFVFVLLNIKIDTFLASILPSFLSDRGSVYVTENIGDEIVQDAWFLKLSMVIIKYFVFLFNYYNYKNFYSKVDLSPKDDRFLHFFLLFFGFSNLVSTTEAYRYSIICNDLTLILFAGFYLNYQPIDEIRKLKNNLLKYSGPFLIFYFFIQFRLFADYCSVYLLAYSPLTHFFIEEQSTFFHWYSNWFK